MINELRHKLLEEKYKGEPEFIKINDSLFVLFNYRTKIENGQECLLDEILVDFDYVCDTFDNRRVLLRELNGDVRKFVNGMMVSFEKGFKDKEETHKWI